MKKIISFFLTAAVVLSQTVFAKENIEISRFLIPAAAVYTHWGDETQTNQTYNYHYVIWANGNENTTYWTQPERVLYYKFDLSAYLNSGYSVSRAVLLQAGPSARIISLIDCPEGDLQNGQNYLTVPSLSLQNRFFIGNMENLNVGSDAIQNKYPGARSNDNCEIDITDYANNKVSQGDASFTYAMYPYYGGGTQIYFSNHPQLYIELARPRENTVFTHINSAGVLTVSGETAADSVEIKLTSPEGDVCFYDTASVAENDAYYRFTADLSENDNGKYTVQLSFDGETVTKSIDYINNSYAPGKVSASVDYSASAVRLYGKMPQNGSEPVMVFVFKPEAAAENTDITAINPDSVYHAQAVNAPDGYFDVKVGMADSGEYSAAVFSSGGTARCEFEYRPEFVTQNNIDKYTATYYAPWLVNWHMTTKQQLDAGYYGGEACQMCWSLEISPVDSDIVFAGTDTNCIWKSIDGGKRWRSTSAGFNSMGTADIAVDPENGNIVYALGGTGGGYGSYEPYTGIYKSTDCGETWERVFNNPYYRKKNNKIIKFGKRNLSGKRRIFAGGHGMGTGAVYSDDEGKTWKTMNGISEYVTIDITLLDDTTVLAGTSGGVFVSYDNGETFAQCGPVTGESSTVTADRGDKNHWICGSGNTLYETTDMGGTWTQINSFPDESGRTLGVSSVAYGYGDNPRLYVYLSPAHYPLRYSTDNGRSFTVPKKTADCTEFIKDNSGWGGEPFALDRNDPDNVIVSFDGELYKSDDGGETYYASSSGYSGMRASGFLFDEDNPQNIFIPSIDRGIVKTIYSGKNEEYPIVDYSPSEDSTGIRYGGSKTTLAAARDPKNHDRIIICIGGSDYTLKQSFDGGNSYFIIPGTSGNSTNFISFNPDNYRTVYAGKLISYDDGETWNESEVAVMAVSPFDGNTVYGMKDGKAARSTDEGRTWTSYGAAIGGSGVQCMICDNADNGVIYVSSYAALIRVLPDGTPEYITPNLKEEGEGKGYYGLTVAQDPKNKYHLVTGGTDNITHGQSGGIFETFDGGVTWRRINGMPASRDIWVMKFHPTLPKVYIGTSAGTFVYDFEKYTDDSVAVTDKKVTFDGTAARYTARFWNTRDKAYDAMFVLACYDKETGKLEGTTVQSFRLKPTSCKDINMTIQASEGFMLKGFIWTDGISPIDSKYDWTVIQREE